MQKKSATWELINKSLQERVPVMLLYVLHSRGSSPGRQGFAMAVTSQGDMEGSIGGGIMEHKFVEMAKELLKKNFVTPSVHQQVHNKKSDHQSGMICSGEQTILLYKLKPADLLTIQQIMKAQDGALQLSAKGIAFTLYPEHETAFNFQKDEWFYEERLGYKNKLFIIGGGHCSLALSRMMRMMDFYIHVYDDRGELHTLLQNDAAHETTVLRDYSELDIPSGVHHYVVVMTVGYRTDDIVLKLLMDKPFAYLGVLGSQAKIDKMFADYSAAGVSAALLSKLHAPIGIPVKSQTPEEIAVSIAAEIIQVKNANLL